MNSLFEKKRITDPGTDGRTDQGTNGRTDKVSYRVAFLNLLRCIRVSLKLSGNSIVETLRNRIPDHVGDDAEFDAKVGELANKFKQSTNKILHGMTINRYKKSVTLVDKTIYLFGAQTKQEPHGIQRCLPF